MQHPYVSLCLLSAARNAANAYSSALQVVNSVVGDDVRTGPNCAIHNCVIASGCTLGEGARLRDCQLAPGYSVPAGADLTEEVLPPPPYRE